MKASAPFVCALVLALNGQSSASSLGSGSPITFDFDALEVPRGDFFISNHMSSVYGSEVSTDGARTVNDDAAGDVYIATSIQLLNRGDFEITFEDVPIVGVQFEGHVIEATDGDDFSLTAYLGQAQVFSVVRTDGVEIFDSGWLDFGGPVDRMVISDDGRRDVGIDALTVMPVPEPAGLAWLALAAVSARRKRRYYSGIS